ncbi:MAG: TraR/DksA C4-type zinc finger protein [Acidimicrobiia bacterium]
MFDAEKTLRDERANLIHQLSELGANEDGQLRDDVSYGEGFADAAAATAERTEVIGLVESVKTMLGNVDAALERVAEGTYGTCAECGKKISQARIEFRPESIYCVDCKAKS